MNLLKMAMRKRIAIVVVIPFELLTLLVFYANFCNFALCSSACNTDFNLSGSNSPQLCCATN